MSIRPSSLLPSVALLAAAAGCRSAEPEPAAPAVEVRQDPAPVPADAQEAPGDAQAVALVEPELLTHEEAGDAHDHGDHGGGGEIDASELDAEGFRTTESRGGMFRVSWRPVGREVPENRHFELEVWLTHGTGGKRPLPGVNLIVTAWMPDHGHGMLRHPQVEDKGDGWYHVKGMLFHMRGRWELYLDVIDNDISERAVFEIDL